MHNIENFHNKAVSTLAYIAKMLDDYDTEAIIDMDATTDIIKLETPKGQYVINKHSAAKQIWLASPISGPYHFSYIDNKWMNKDKVDLLEILSEELSQFFETNLQYE
ncbi:MAG UNVERIFIED_CONTAM: iron donor protein CyaY [Rickettsiaceae bacterium]|jgi:CyaY protein